MNYATPSSSRTFVASLHPLAARFNLKPHLSDVTLANVLAGDTCAPISLADFERHLTFVEYSVENLQFLVWFQDYRERYLKFTRKQTSPSHDDFAFRTPSRARTEQRAAESLARLQVDIEELGKDDAEEPSPTSPADAPSPTSPSPMLPPKYTQLSTPPLAYTIPKSSDADSHRFRAECERAVATFLSPLASKELSLDAIVRDTVIRNLSLDCHPDVFLPVYEEVYTQIERGILPRFLSTASANINLPKQIYWYIVGTCNIAIGLLIALLLIMMVPTPPEANRAWRIFPAGFCSLGSAQCYSAWRGYCSQVWMRGNTQLRVWEMQEMDDEALAFVDRILGPCKDRQRTQDTASPPPHDEHEIKRDDKKQHPSARDVAVIAPFAIEPLTRVGQLSQSSDTVHSYGWTTAASVHHFHRPPVFGPETVVLDPHIKAVHRQVLIQVCRFGVWVMLAFSALVFSVPSRSHP
ncbi:hypothetical protein FPV67DRAFT_1777227 [Lyophyllum atratum]|nr:hypothetical protein FPV67DRAFT_1777227 [Lyophyllum atratum]